MQGLILNNIYDNIIYNQRLGWKKVKLWKLVITTTGEKLTEDFQSLITNSP